MKVVKFVDKKDGIWSVKLNKEDGSLFDLSHIGGTTYYEQNHNNCITIDSGRISNGYTNTSIIYVTKYNQLNLIQLVMTMDCLCGKHETVTINAKDIERYLNKCFVESIEDACDYINETIRIPIELAMLLNIKFDSITSDWFDFQTTSCEVVVGGYFTTDGYTVEIEGSDYPMLDTADALSYSETHGVYFNGEFNEYYIWSDNLCDWIDPDNIDDIYYVNRYHDYYNREEVEFCVDSQQWELLDDCYYCEEDDSWYYDADNAPEIVIKDYHESEFHDSNYNINWMDRAIQFGVEIEVEFSDFYDKKEAFDCLDRNRAREHFYDMERDGSLDNGFEIVTKPLLYNKKVNKGLDRIFRIIKQNNARFRNCGQHIHIDRKCFRNDKAIVLFARTILQTYRDKFIELSRRDNFEYCEFKKMSLEELVYDYTSHSSFSRYQAINFRNEHTVELRFFKGGDNIKTLYDRLELIKRLIKSSNKGKVLPFDELVKGLKNL